jgi:hypothetical protein
MKNTMKNAMKVMLTLSLCLILWEGYGQTNLPSNDELFNENFVSFVYDGGTSHFVPATSLDLLAPLPSSNHSQIKRSSMEDIWKEKEENQTVSITVGQTQTTEPAILAVSKH